MMRADEGFISDACPMQPAGTLGMQGGPLVPPAQQWGVWTCLTSRWAAPACLRLVLAFENTNTKLASTSAARSSRFDLRRMDAVDTSAVNT